MTLAPVIFMAVNAFAAVLFWGGGGLVRGGLAVGGIAITL